MSRFFGIDVEEKGVGKTVTDLKALEFRARGVKRVSEQVRSVFRESEVRQFATEGRGRWPRLADSTRERKSRQGLSLRTMHATDTLYRSLTATRASGQIDRRSEDELRFGTTVYYARFHQRGQGVPQRPLIDIQPNERQRMRDIIRAYIAKGDTRTSRRMGFGGLGE